MGATRGQASKRREWDWRMVPWRSLAWLALWCALMEGLGEYKL